MKTNNIVLIFFVLCVLACSDIIEVPDISFKSVNVLAPIDGAIVTTTNVIFSWEPVEDAKQYHIQIATPNFANAVQVVKDSTLTGSNYTTILDANTYEWQVRAENSGYQTPYTTQNFTVEE